MGARKSVAKRGKAAVERVDGGARGGDGGGEGGKAGGFAGDARRGGG